MMTVIPVSPTPEELARQRRIELALRRFFAEETSEADLAVAEDTFLRCIAAARLDRSLQLMSLVAEDPVAIRDAETMLSLARRIKSEYVRSGPSPKLEV